MSASNPEQKSVEKTLQKENKALRTEIKQLEIKVKTMQGDLHKSTTLKDRLEGLCRELQKQNRFIKAESSAKIAEANAKGKELAQEVQNNMGFMKNINQNLASITSESLEVKRENEDLARKIATLKDHYEEREKILQTALTETNALLLMAKQELGEFRLRNAEEKEKLYTEMQQLANALVQSREQMKEAKETEITLRNLIQNYDDKFNGLQKALKDTNGAYDEFKQEMTKVTGRTKDLEKETSKWQSRWEESHTALTMMGANHQRLQGELIKAQESLAKMTNLCRALQVERKELLSELKVEEEKKGIVKTTPDEAELQLNERAKLVDDIDNDSQTRSQASADVLEEIEKTIDSFATNPSLRFNDNAQSPEANSATKTGSPAANGTLKASDTDSKAIETSSTNVNESEVKPEAAKSVNAESKDNEPSQDKSSNNQTASTNAAKQNQKGKNQSNPTTPTKNKNNKKPQKQNQSQPCSPSKKDPPQQAEVPIKQTNEDKTTTKESPAKSPTVESNVAPKSQEPKANIEDITPTKKQEENATANVMTAKDDLENKNSQVQSISSTKNEPEKAALENVIQPTSTPVKSDPEKTTTDNTSQPIKNEQENVTPEIASQPSSTPVKNEPENVTPEIASQPSSTPAKNEPENVTPEIVSQLSSTPAKNESENVTPEIVSQPSSTPAKNEPEKATPANGAQPCPKPPVSPKPSKDAPKPNKKGPSAPKGEEAPKSNKKSKKHK